MDESKVTRYATENFVDKNILFTIKKDIILTVPASDIKTKSVQYRQCS